MFKKKPTIKPLAPIRSSDRRKLADQIISEYGLEKDTGSENSEQTPEQKAEAIATRTSLRNSLLPDNTQSARFTTTYGPELKQASGTVYVGSQDGEESRILWFEIDKRIIPSIYTLWRNPDVVPLLHTPDIVIKKLQGGADLMTPGLAGGPPFPPRAKKGAVVAIAGTDRLSVPVAVGICEIDVSALEQVRGAKGHAVENMHWAGDELWGYSTASKPGQQPPEEIEGWSKVLEERGLIDKVRDLALDEQEDGGGVSLGVNGDGGSGTGAVQAEASKAPGNMNALAETVEAKELTQKEIDDAFRNAFLYGVHHFKTTNPDAKNHGLVFPLQQSFVMATLVQPFLPAYSPEQAQQLQIKKTSWKNIKKFVKSLDKEKIIKSKDRDGNEVVIQDIDFDDAAILNFKPYRLPKEETATGTSTGRGELATEKIDTGDDSVGQKLQVITSYRPTSKLQPIFDAAKGTKTLYAPPEVRELITAYIESENLISETNKRLIKLNPILANSVFDGSGPLDKEVLAKGSVPRDALIDRILHNMSTSYSIIRNNADPSSVKPKSGTPPKIHITLETRSGNKTVTKRMS
ncbi:Eukaryotic translation initiation factor 2D [Pseudocercospora fuligena]|uniref:Eukaryotic translation initiation factor 2D n=1 Tax=Pseudocercospora fuligena TaxID=685502 RepID=A0A8H6VGI8_9PEZI|nr:Eukaryotic translation initiation factor 2D [Pseudocercospora fuligena]